jgi:cob(I)alamin adenosyltransferase
MMASGDYDLVVLDEINIALRYEYLQPSAVIEALDARDKRTGVILTGRDAKPEIMDYADLVSEMVEIKHPHAAGIKAQRGVDYQARPSGMTGTAAPESSLGACRTG